MRLTLAGVLAAIPAAEALAFGIDVHERLPRHAFARHPLPRDLDARQADLGAFWSWLRATARAAVDRADRDEIDRRWPPGDPWALKMLLAMNPDRRVFGIDRLDEGRSRLDLLSKASAHPDVDGRDRGRLARGPDRRPLTDRHGQPVPDDPAILNMGSLDGLSSQAHAHYGLAPGPLSDDPEVLRKRPERFAIARAPGAPAVLTFAAERAQLHADLALLAALWGGPGSDRLVAHFTGAGWHYLQDVASQVHTVQVGLYDFFVRAKLLYWGRALLTAGGYLAELRPFTAIGIDILSNHHVFAETLGARRLLAAERAGGGRLGQALEQMARDVAGVPDALPDRFAEALVQWMIDRSAPEGALVYRAAIEASDDALRSYGFRFEEDEPRISRWLRPGSEPAVARLDELMARGLCRAATAMRRWWKAHEDTLRTADRAALARAVAARLVGDRLRYRREAEARRAAYLASVEPPRAGAVREPVWIAIDAGILVALALGGWGIVRLARRRTRR